MLLGEQVGPVPDVQGPDPLRPFELVGGQADQVGAERLEVEIDPRGRLDGIDVEDDARGPRTRSAISATGWIVPTSLFASMMLTRIVRSVTAASTSSGSTRP